MSTITKTSIITLTSMSLLFACTLFSVPATHPDATSNFPLSLNWKVTTRNKINALATSQNYVVIADQGGLEVIDFPKQDVIWKDDFVLLNNSSLRISNEIIFAVNSSELRAYASKSGKIIWKTILNDDDGRPEILLSTSNDVFLLRVGAWVVQAYDKSSGKLLWETPSSRGGVYLIQDGDRDLLYLLGNENIQAYNASSGAFVWQRDVKGITGPGLYVSGILYYYAASSTFPNRTGRLTALDVSNNKEIWTSQLILQANNISILDKKLIISTEGGLLAIEPTDGQLIWKNSSTDDFQLPPLLIDNIIFAKATDTNNIYAIDLSNGNTIGYIEGNQSSIESASDEILGIYEMNNSLISPIDNTIYGYIKK